MKTPTKKLCSALVLILLVLPMLAGCAGHKDQPTVSSTPSAPQAPPPSVAHDIAVQQGKAP